MLTIKYDLAHILKQISEKGGLEHNETQHRFHNSQKGPSLFVHYVIVVLPICLFPLK